MEFIQSLWLAVAAFLGIGVLDEAPLPAREEVASMAMEAESFIADTLREAEQAAEELAPNLALDSETNTTVAPSEELAPTAPVVSEMSGEAKPVNAPVATLAPDIKTMLVAGGCFWCVESDLEKVPGVISVVSGYAGGTTENPTYQNYGSGGHREVVEVTYDANRVSFEDILIVTMKTTDPTDDDGTFADRGDKYSAAFYYETPAQQKIIADLIAEVDQNGPYDAPLAIDVEPRATFYKAEDYHQDYYKGTLSQLKYKYYRNASGRDDFIKKYWSDPHSPALPWRTNTNSNTQTTSMNFWESYVKPSKTELEKSMDALAFKVTQEDGTERAGTSPLDKNWEDGIYVDILSGEPLFSSKDKYDSGTGWPSFVKPISPTAVTEHEDRKLFSVRTETRSAIADNHLGHVFTDGPKDRGGLRYCMNGVALRFVPKAEMEAAGYGAYLDRV